MRTLPPMLLALLLALPAHSGQPELAIYPGFSKDELPTSVGSMVRTAATCLRAADDDEAEVRPAVAPHLSATIVDGAPVELEERHLDVTCGAAPVRRCAFTYVSTEGTDQIGFGSIQCYGSHEDAYTSYLVTAAIDLQRAKKAGVLGTRKDKAVVMTSLTFQTDAFPGSHVTAFVARKRVDGSTEEPPMVMEFDDFATTDDASGALTADELHGLAKSVVDLTCRATGQCDTPQRALTATRDR